MDNTGNDRAAKYAGMSHYSRNAFDEFPLGFVAETGQISIQASTVSASMSLTFRKIRKEEVVARDAVEMPRYF